MLNTSMLNQKPTFSFDLISDLYIDLWPEEIEWPGLPTSLIGVVAGNISDDLDRVVHELKRMGEAYRQLLYIDGSLENNNLAEVEDNQEYLREKLDSDHIHYLHEQVVVINGVAFLGANLWAPSENLAFNDDAWDQELACTNLVDNDIAYLTKSVARMQNHPEVSRIVIVTHAVPNSELLDIGSSTLAMDVSDYVEIEDKKHRIKYWCCGSAKVQHQAEHCTYTSNPRGKPQNNLGLTYYPLRVEL